MRTAPENWNQILSNSGYSVEYRLTIAGVTYDGHQIDSETFEIDRAAFRSLPFVGGVEAATLKFTLLPKGTIPKGAEVLVEERLVFEGLSTEWEEKGTFTIDTRRSHSDGWFTFTAYDDMPKADKKFLTDTESREWPIAADVIATEIASRMGLSLDERSVIDPSIKVPYPNEKTMRSILSDLGMALCANWTVTESRTLYCRPLRIEAPSVQLSQDDPILFEETGDAITVTQVVLITDEDGNGFSTPEVTDGFTLTLNLEWGSDSIASSLLEKLSDIRYVPFSLQHYLNPLIEVGDTIEYDGISYIVGNALYCMNEQNFCEMGAPYVGAVEHEYPHYGAIEQSVANKVTLGKSYYGTTISRREGIRVDRILGELILAGAIFNADELAFYTMVNGTPVKAFYYDAEAKIFRLTQSSDIEEALGQSSSFSKLETAVDGITLEVTSVSTSGGQTYARIRLRGGNGEWQEGQIMLEGNVNVSGQLSAEALYAVLGDVANLMVNRLSTSRRIPKYLAGDTTDDRYWIVEGESQRMVRAWTDGSIEQARNPDGVLLYWEQDVEGALEDGTATLGANGYPEIEGVQVPTTTTPSPYEVWIYKYQEGDRWKQTFAEDGNYGPRQIWGEGDGTPSGKGRGYIEKLGLSFDIYNHGTDGVKRGMFMGNDYVDIVGERQPTKMVANDDTIEVTYQGGKTKTFSFSRGTDGKINAVTYDGHTVTLEGFD